MSELDSTAREPSALGHSWVGAFSGVGFCVLCGEKWSSERLLEACPGAVGMTPLEHGMSVVKYLEQRRQ